MGLFSTKPRGMTPAEEAARRRGGYIPDDGRVNAAQARADHRAATAAPQKMPHEPAYETKRVRLWESGFLGSSHPDQRKLEQLIADGWEIVNKERGTRRPWYTLRRAR
jgi:hypothetical protein